MPSKTELLTDSPTPRGPHSVIVTDEGDYRLHHVQPNYGIVTLTWDDEFASTAADVCRAMNKAWLAGQDHNALTGLDPSVVAELIALVETSEDTGSWWTKFDSVVDRLRPKGGQSNAKS